MWDVFISHASEDKDELVRPLAEELLKYGLKVWYDEFSLKLGDSLTESIDKGMLNSEYGLIVLSPDFFKKSWTDYELKSLLTKEINGGKTILPVWHKVDQRYISSKSLFLVDKKAVSSDIGIPKLAFEIVNTVRPDIINSHMLKSAFKKIKTNEKVKININDIGVIDGVRHKTLPMYLAVATDVISTLFPFSAYREFVRNFAKDANYDVEFVVWVAISCTYIESLKKYDISLANDAKCKEIFKYLLSLSINDTDSNNDSMLNEDEKRFVESSYYKHLTFLLPMIK